MKNNNGLIMEFDIMHEIPIKLIFTTDNSLKTNKKKRALRI
jgi:hypothetical protein